MRVGSAIDGAITVAVALDDGRVSRVDIRNGRAVQAARVFEGKGVAETLALVPLLFSLCGEAQLQAGLAAAEAASGVVPAEPHRVARHLLLLAETLGEHGVRTLKDWPGLFGDAADMEGARALKLALAGWRNALYPDRDSGQLGGGRLAPDREDVGARMAEVRRVVDAAVFGGAWAGVLADVSGLWRWAGQGATAPARQMYRVNRDDLIDFGRSTIAPLPPLDPAELERRLAADKGGSFLARPDWQGGAYETGPFARRNHHPAVAGLMPVYGNGVGARFVAQLVEIGQVLDEMEALAPHLRAAPASTAPVEPDGSGLGVIEAARGLLVHRVAVRAGRVARWQILAPTEWNFHPQGALARGLLGAVAPRDEVEKRAALLVAALDPCVACRVTVAGAGE